MESIDYIGSLRENDLPELSSPPGFDRKLALEEVESFRASLEEYFGFLPVLDDQIQDATHYAELELKPKVSREKCATIRFSKFGRLVTILYPEILGAEKLPWVIDAIRRKGYAFIPFEILDRPYEGKQEGIPTWMTRFFYYY